MHHCVVGQKVVRDTVVRNFPNVYDFACLVHRGTCNTAHKCMLSATTLTSELLFRIHTNRCWAKSSG